MWFRSTTTPAVAVRVTNVISSIIYRYWSVISTRTWNTNKNWILRSGRRKSDSCRSATTPGRCACESNSTDARGQVSCYNMMRSNESRTSGTKRIVFNSRFCTRVQMDHSLRACVCVCVLDGVLSYSMPQGDKRSPDWEFYDSTYDGYWDDELRRGLGQLTDGKVGPDNFRMGYYDAERGTFVLFFFQRYT